MLSAAQSGRAECGEPTSNEFVEGLYEQQARLQAAKTPLGEDEFRALFAGELRELMDAPRHYPPNEPEGPVLNAFFGWGVLPGTEIKIGKVARVSGKDPGPATVSVKINYRGKDHGILVRAVTENGAWRIADISYDSGKSLLSRYRKITGH